MGGTKTSAALVSADGGLHRLSTIPTPAAEHVEAAIIELVRSLVGTSPRAVGLSVAGFVSDDGRALIFSPNIPGWHSPDLAGRVSSAVGCPVIVENDGNAATWAEAVHGAGRGAQNIVCLTVGTGLGGGLVLGGDLQRGGWGFAGEFGHLTLIPRGRQCSCGLSGCWETYVSGRALVREAKSALEGHTGSESVLLEIAGGDVDRITGPMVMQAAVAEDSAATVAYARVGSYLGQGIADLAAVVDPEMVVVGGGVSVAGELLLGPARTEYERLLSGRRYRRLAVVETASLGPEAGIVGAAELARRRVSLSG